MFFSFQSDSGVHIPVWGPVPKDALSSLLGTELLGAAPSWAGACGTWGHSDLWGPFGDPHWPPGWAQGHRSQPVFWADGWGTDSATPWPCDCASHLGLSEPQFPSLENGGNSIYFFGFSHTDWGMGTRHLKETGEHIQTHSPRKSGNKGVPFLPGWNLLAAMCLSVPQPCSIVVARTDLGPDGTGQKSGKHDSCTGQHP